MDIKKEMSQQPGESKKDYIHRLRTTIAVAGIYLSEAGNAVTSGIYMGEDVFEAVKKFTPCERLIPHEGYYTVFVGKVRPAKAKAR